MCLLAPCAPPSASGRLILTRDSDPCAGRGMRGSPQARSALRPIDLDRLSRLKASERAVPADFKRRKWISLTSKPKEALLGSYSVLVEVVKRVSCTGNTHRVQEIHSRLSVRNPPPKCLHARQQSGSRISAAHSHRSASGAPAGLRGARPLQQQCALRRRTEFKTSRRSGRGRERAMARVPAADCTCTQEISDI